MSTWIGPAARIADARRRFADAKADAERRTDDPATVLALLEAWGRALACGALTEPVDGGPAKTAVQVEEALARELFDLVALEDAGVAIADALAANDEDVAATETVLANALEVRDRIEYVLLAAEQASASAPALSLDQQIFLVEFDHLVRPLLSRLTAFNELRGEIASTVMPALRARFWWWCEGVSIAPGAATHLAAVAELIERFPDARAQLDALVAAARAVRATAAEQPAPKVTRLAEWVAHRRRGRPAELRIAAASSDERIDVATTAEYEVSWRPPSAIVIDVHVEPRAAPHARLPSGRVLASSLVPRTVHRYRIMLDAEALAEDAFVVVIPLAGGDVDVAFPPADR